MQGPWTFSGQDGDRAHCYPAQVWAADGHSLAVIDPQDDATKATDIARVMAASPLLLEAAKDLAKETCTTFGAEDIESGCCPPCLVQGALVGCVIVGGLVGNHLWDRVNIRYRGRPWQWHFLRPLAGTGYRAFWFGPFKITVKN